ncbi:hypothetical protein CTKA_01574 [Chthonomonas calidirosea]|uniref:Tetratricopeptide repeat n=1 Tax=Chthonomonas calidirosea (strain DSM 23976 / ICMP 18418 / T49) TaxID=1303518 RepID=S0EZI9_CHTCT|nr:hypothetical protein [Chthonomonas calidirosea]CCW36314.1 hypothetical protein CCALI_02517 [Chthonomonas calidirosea T49]CEK17698.1 hypothetical protein CTKA_01574 [Chthonomonas calidirosea]
MNHQHLCFKRLLGLCGLGILGLLQPMPSSQAQIAAPQPDVRLIYLAVVPFIDHVNALLFTACQWEQKGQYARAFSLAKQALAYVEDKHTQQQAQEAVKAAIKTVEQMQKGSSASVKEGLIGSSSEDYYEQEMLARLLSKKVQTHIYLGHLLTCEGEYRKAVQEFDAGRGEEVIAQYPSADGRSLLQKTKSVLDLMTPPLPMCNPYFDEAYCEYHLGEYAKAMETFCAGLEEYGMMTLYPLYYARFKKTPQLVGPKELGAVLALMESGNVTMDDGASSLPFRIPPDPRYSYNWDKALKYAEEGYKLMPNNLDLAQQYYVLLCTFKRYQEAIEVWRHMYALAQKGPSAYETVDPCLMQDLWGCLVLVPDTEWEAWKRAHGGRDAYPIPVINSLPSKH